jgi:ubiquinone/menaquinone biosynthesis C-methylase UbiE
VTDLNPHAKQMADESMVRTLDAQARAIWPQESELIRRYGLKDDLHILDAGCGTGEAASRLAEMFPRATILGVDILDQSLEIARSRYARFAPRLTFENQSAYELKVATDTYDLVVNRHVIHSIPHPERVLKELVRVTKPGGRLHLIPEDYGMLHFERRAGELDPGEFWHDVPRQFGDATETDPHIGRHTYAILVDLGLTHITVDYVVVDTVRVPRPTFAAIIEAWRDGYVEPVAQYSHLSHDEARAYFDRMIANIRDPRGYAVWMVPVVSAIV